MSQDPLVHLHVLVDGCGQQLPQAVRAVQPTPVTRLHWLWGGGKHQHQHTHVQVSTHACSAIFHAYVERQRRKHESEFARE